MASSRYYDTLSEAVDDLIIRGYTDDFLIMSDEDCLYCKRKNLRLSPEEFVIDEIYRFEGMTDPADESIVFAISSDEHLVKGLIINGYGAGSESSYSRLAEHLHSHL